MFDRLREVGFDVRQAHHAEALVTHDFEGLEQELTECLLGLRLPATSLIGGGGGEAEGTQYLRRALAKRGWVKRVLRIEKNVVQFEGTPGKSSFRETGRDQVASLSHEIDHVKQFPAGTALLEIEWNNKDPFFDRDLENFKRLHADGAASLGVIITRGASFQNGIEEKLAAFVRGRQLNSIADLERVFNLDPTRRQRANIDKAVKSSGDFAKGWAKAFVADKFGQATTHWSKLHDRLSRGVGNPCPLIAIGIPLNCVLDE